MKNIARVMCLVVAVATCPKLVEGTGDKAPASELSELAAWEAQSPEAAAFEGGDASGVLLTIVLIAAVVIIVYLLLEHEKGHSMTSPADAAPPPPPLFR